MCQFIESIRVFNKKAEYLSYHQRRIEKTLFYHNINIKIDLKKEFLKLHLSDGNLYKWRIIYGENGISISELIAYTPKQIKEFHCIEIDFSYPFKYFNRIDFEQNNFIEECKEPIYLKNGFVTDTSFSNLIFLKNEIWHIPEDYLLNGTQRQKIINEGKAKIQKIHKKDIKNFSHFAMINAMLPMEQTKIYDIEHICIEN